jgi:hypothetical protein
MTARSLFLALLLAITASVSSALAVDPRFESQTKPQIRKRLGFPAQVILDPIGRENWFYYWIDKYGDVQLYILGFRSGKVTDSSDKPEFDPHRVLSTERDSDLQKIYEHLKGKPREP